MTAGTQDYRLEISEHLFHLATESLRLRSNETRCFETLARLVDHLAATAKIETHDTDTLRDHLVTIPTKGDIRIHLTIAQSNVDTFAEAQRKLGVQIGSELTVGDALSLLLFDYVVERKTARILDKLDLKDGPTISEQIPANDSQA